MSRYVDGMSCITPRAPTQLFAEESRPLSAMPCALKYFQSNAGPKYRFVYLRKVGSYRSLIFFALRAAAARSIAFPAFLTEDCAAATPPVQSDSVTNAA